MKINENTRGQDPSRDFETLIKDLGFLLIPWSKGEIGKDPCYKYNGICQTTLLLGRSILKITCARKGKGF